MSKIQNGTIIDTNRIVENVTVLRDDNLSLSGIGISFICDSCGREVYGCNIVNGMKFCAKCYQETFGNQQKYVDMLNKENSDLLVNLLAEKDKQIAELKQQLEEKEKLLQYGMTEIKNLHKRINGIVKRDEKLIKSQPAEIVKKINGEIYTRMIVECKETKYTDINLILDDILKEYQK